MDAEDTIETFVLKRRRRGVQNILKRYDCIFSTRKVGIEIDAIKTRISRLTTSLQTYNIKSIGGEEARSFGINSRNETRECLLGRSYSLVIEEDIIGVVKYGGFNCEIRRLQLSIMKVVR